MRMMLPGAVKWPGLGTVALWDQKHRLDREQEKSDKPGQDMKALAT